MRPFVLYDKSTCILLVDLCVHMDHSYFQIQPLILNHFYLDLHRSYNFKREGSLLPKGSIHLLSIVMLQVFLQVSLELCGELLFLVYILSYHGILA